MPLGGFLLRVWYLIRRDKYAADLEEEMRLHLEMRAESLRQRGMSAGHAASASRRRFGNVTAMTEVSRDMWGFANLDQLRQDIRFGLRRLRQRRAVSVPVIAVLALGIGAVTAVFTAIDAAMLRALPFAHADRLLALSSVQVPFEREREVIGDDGRLLRITDVEQMSDVFDGVAVYASGSLNLMDEERPMRVKAGVVTAGLFPLLGIHPSQGRGFGAEEGKPNGPLVVMLSHRLWERRFGRDAMIGRSIVLHGRSHQVVGIMPAGFTFPNDSDLWIPMTVPLTFAALEPFRGFLPSTVVGRMRRGVTREQSVARLEASWERVTSPATGDRRSSLEEWLATVRQDGVAVPLQQNLVGDKSQALLVLFGATAFLLIIACANVANLLLSDAAMRQRELAVRSVLGATRSRIARQLFIECILLALGGAALGVLLAPAILKILRAMMPAALVSVAPLTLDVRVLTFAIVLAFVTSLVFGLWPALGASKENASDPLKSGSGHGTTSRRSGVVRRTLVAAELAMAVLLLVGAGLMLRSFAKLMSEDLGMQPEQVATLEMGFARTVPPAERRRVVNAVIARLASDPRIRAAGAVNDLPLRGGGGISITLDVPGAPPPKAGELPGARHLYATADYFAAMGIPLIRGRTFRTSDAGGPPVAVISKGMADKYWPGRDPIGSHFSWRGDTTRFTVVGVVGDVREYTVAHDPQPQMYRFLDEASAPNVALLARGSLPPAQLLAHLQDAVRAVAPSQPVYNVRMMEDVVHNSVRPQRTNTLLIGIFAGLALVLAALGVYSVVSYGAAQRRREFGIRSALGATRSDLVRLVSRDMVASVAVGLAIGLGAAWALSRVLESLLYEVDARDPTTFATVPLVLIVPAIIATLVPAMRAARVSPTEVMRTD